MLRLWFGWGSLMMNNTSSFKVEMFGPIVRGHVYHFLMRKTITLLALVKFENKP